MDFVVLKVNGKDVSSASHEDTIAAFTTAEEPIIVEVLKRPPKATEASMYHCNTSTQTDWSGATYGVLPLNQTNDVQQGNNDVGTNHYSVIGGELEEEEACEVEYEEVVLQRNPNGAKLGLTLCYGAPDDPDTDIYITVVEPDSVAGKDGRILEGDQLLQINGIDVRSREQAVDLFSEKRTDFTLLLARPQISVEEYFLDDNATEYGQGPGYNILLEQEEEDGTTDTGTTENAHLEKDSGFGRTDESTKNDESSDHEAVDALSFTGSKFQCSFKDFRGEIQLTPLCRFQSDASLDREMALLNKEMENIQLECESLVHRHLESQQKGRKDTNRCHLEHVYVNLADLNAPKAPNAVLPLNKQESVKRWVNSMVLADNSSSAYNTADSSGSTPLTLELTPVSIKHGEIYGSVMSLVKMEDKGTQLRESDVASMFSCDSCRRCCKALVERNVSSIPSNNNSNNVSYSSKLNKIYQSDGPNEENNRNYVTFYPSPNTMYTNQANLQHTIWLQQQMLRQQLAQQKNKSNAPPSNRVQSMNTMNGYHFSSSASKSGTLSTVKEDEELKMEWKVKKRADGTRYITRRPVRNRILKARALKILEERTGITTDDEAVSELKIGRYWSKEERKRHLERARDRKRKEMVIRSKMASVREQGEDSEEVAKKEISILELSHKKMMKRRGKVVFDDFTTVQEVLAHGSKIANPGGKPLGLLTVTTV